MDISNWLKSIHGARTVMALLIGLIAALQAIEPMVPQGWVSIIEIVLAIAIMIKGRYFSGVTFVNSTPIDPSNAGG